VFVGTTAAGEMFILPPHNRARLSKSELGPRSRLGMHKHTGTIGDPMGDGAGEVSRLNAETLYH
jgi:hypothetical protein